MFERYTEKARRVIFFGRFEAKMAGAGEIGPEHLLLAIARDSGEVLARLIGEHATEPAIRAEIAKMEPTETSQLESADLPLSNPSKRVLAYSAEEADRLGSRVIAPGHLLLALMRESGCEAERSLRRLGGNLESMRERMAYQTSGEVASGAGGQGHGTAGATQSGRVNQAAENPDWTTVDVNKVGFQYYTVKARRAVFFARFEASRMGTGTMEPEHLLLGMWREAPWEINGLMGRSDPWPELQKRIEARMPKQSRAISTDMPLSEALKRVLVLAAEEAKQMNTPVGVGHLTLGLLRLEQCFAGDLLRERGAEGNAVRLAVKEQLASRPEDDGKGDRGQWDMLT